MMHTRAPLAVTLVTIVWFGSSKPISSQQGPLRTGQAGKVQVDIASVQELARHGDVEAADPLGWSYLTGNGVSQDYYQAVQWYQQAAVAPTSPSIDARDIKIDGRPIRGAQDAKVTIVFFDDFQCPYSAAMYRTLFDEVIKDYAGRVKVTLRDVPNAQIHPSAMHAAIDANCLAAQDVEAYWDFADYVHAHQTEVTADRLDNLALERGQKHNLQVVPLQECIQAQSDAAIKPARSEAIHHLGVKAVPMLFINGENLEGALPAQKLREAIDRALHAVGLAVTPTVTEAQQ